MNISSIFNLLRPYQYVKNLFIFLPAFFGLKINNVQTLFILLFAFIAFCLTASAVYILNDYLDIESDRCHPTKKNRPLASNAISKRAARFIMTILFTIGFVFMMIISWPATIVLAIYVLLNVAYSISLKHVAIIDVGIIAVGFVLRLYVGATSLQIDTSMWIILMTFLLALFIALAKRRDDVLIFIKTGKKMRQVIDGYNIAFLDIAMSVMASVVIVAYIFYTISAEVQNRLHSEHLYLTAIFVIIGILRYMQIIFVEENSGSPTEVVLKDKMIQLMIVMWTATYVCIIYV